MPVCSAIRSRLVKSSAELRNRPNSDDGDDEPGTGQSNSPPRGCSHRTNHPHRPDRGIRNNRCCRRHPRRRRRSAFAYFARHRIDNTLQQIGSDSNVLAFDVDTVSLPCHQHHQPLISGELFHPKTTPFASPWISDAAVTTTVVVFDVVAIGRCRDRVTFFPGVSYFFTVKTLFQCILLSSGRQ